MAAVLLLGPWPQETEWFPSWDQGRTFGSSVTARTRRDAASAIVSRIYREILEQHPDGEHADPFEVDSLLSDALVNLSIHSAAEVYDPAPVLAARGMAPAPEGVA